MNKKSQKVSESYYLEHSIISGRMTKTMLKTINVLLGAFIVLFAISCSSSPNVVNNYYINGKKVNSKNLPSEHIAQNDSTKQVSNSTESWVNPLNNNNNNATSSNIQNKANDTIDNSVYSSENEDSESLNIYGGNVVINNSSRYVNRNYVPVINPWWNNWSAISYSPFYGSGFSFGSPCVVYDWYSPWYNYHPYYGNSWAGIPSWGYWSWCSQPLYSYFPRRLNGNVYRNYYPDYDNYRYGNMSNRNNYGSRNESYGYSNNTIGNSRNNTTSIYKNWNSNSINNNNQNNSSSRNGVIKTGYVSEVPSSRNGNVYNSNRNDNNSVNTGNNSSRNIYGGNSGLGNTNGNAGNSKNGSNSTNDNNSSRNNNKRDTENNEIFKSRENKPSPRNNTPVRPPSNNDVNKGSRNNGGNSVNPMPNKNTSPPVAAPSNNGGSSRNGRR